MVSITVNGLESLAVALAGLEAALTHQDQLPAVWARAGVNVLKTHFRALDAQFPNKMGGRRTHFWESVGDTVQIPVVGPASITIAITHPIIAHKAGLGPAGGVIVPKAKKWLAIPVAREAYGLSPLAYESGGGSDRELRFAKISDVKAVLLEVLAAKGPKGGKKWRVVYSLRKKVVQKPFPRALPSQEDFVARIGEATDDFLAALPALAGT